MRCTAALLVAAAFVGCERIDANRTNPVPHTPAAKDQTEAAPTTAPSSSAAQRSNSEPAAGEPVGVAPSGSAAQNAPPDNTAVNQRDRSPAAKTPIDQDENQPDINRTAEIRTRVLDTADMSVNARNVKIMTSQGRVALRGPVNSDAERDTIARIARDVAGDANVDNQIEVKNP